MNLPEHGFLRLNQIIGQDELTPSEAERNRRRIAEAIAAGRTPPKVHKRPRAAIPGLIPIGPTQWWEGVREGRFPKPVKFPGGRTALWRVEDIRQLIESAK